jgi:excisionase family DNA binding protein
MNDPTHIPEGAYLTKTQAAQLRGVTERTIQQWIDKGWLTAIQIPGLGYLINEKDLQAFTPPKPGPRNK